ncbi:MAG: polyketide synthase dehydratase domain-containing protein [Spirochaetes bacterium]|nr:polyketide synthase dehydratase domain-containing protein [Spirochaetota bacterium]
MEDLPVIDTPQRIPVPLPGLAYLQDHRFLGQAVLPAVESLELLAAAVRSACPALPCTDIRDIDLKRFLELPVGGALRCFADITRRADGSVAATLSSSRRAGARGIARTVEHVSARFTSFEAPPSPPMDVIAGLSGICRRVEKASLYGAMVPFGPSFHNAERVFISIEGAAAFLRGGPEEAGERILGSPFTLDAAFHAACVWGQSLYHFVGFPTAIRQRVIMAPTKPGAPYFARIVPVSFRGDHFMCHIWIYGMEGTLHEAALGLTMKDISAGRLAPSPWVDGPDAAIRFAAMREACDGMMLLELEAMPSFAGCAFTDRELARFVAMGEKRKRTYAGSRIACKRLSRELPGGDALASPRTMETVADGSDAPRLPAGIGADSPACSVSHDSRFVFCAARRGGIGVDVEAGTERLRTTKRFYAEPEEQHLAAASALGELQGLLRIWTIKESAAKALGVPLSEAWKKTRVTELGSGRSKISIDGRPHIALHETVDDHLFTLLTL